MKKFFALGSVLIVLGLIIFFLRKQKAAERVMTNGTSVADGGVMAIDAYVAKHPVDPAAPQLRRLSAALRTQPAMQETVLGQAAVQSIQDGAVSPQEAVMLQEAASLAEKSPVSDKELKAFSAKYPASPVAAVTPEPPASVTHASSAIDTYVKKHPTGRGVSQLKRLSDAAKTRPAQSRVFAETAARSLEDGTVSKEEAQMLEEAAHLAEQEGLSPKEMAEFSSKYAQGVGLAQKPVSTEIPKEAGTTAPMASFEGNKHLTYTFTGQVKCAPKPCANIRVAARVTAGKWVETRQDGVDPQGQYFLQMPILSGVNEKVLWQLEAHDKDLRKTELNGEQTTSEGDSDISIQNNVMIQ